jgi:hypothetical protein
MSGQDGGRRTRMGLTALSGVLKAQRGRVSLSGDPRETAPKEGTKRAHGPRAALCGRPTSSGRDSARRPCPTPPMPGRAPPAPCTPSRARHRRRGGAHVSPAPRQGSSAYSAASGPRAMLSDIPAVTPASYRLAYLNRSVQRPLAADGVDTGVICNATRSPLARVTASASAHERTEVELFTEQTSVVGPPFFKSWNVHPLPAPGATLTTQASPEKVPGGTGTSVDGTAIGAALRSLASVSKSSIESGYTAGPVLSKALSNMP